MPTCHGHQYGILHHSETFFLALQVADWARLQFYAEVSKGEAHITLAKACMLIALEEEAAAAADEQERRAGASRASSGDDAPTRSSRPRDMHTGSRR